MMGDFEELESERTADHAAPSPGARAASRTGAALPAVVVPELPGWRVRSRRPLDEERILEEVQPGSLEAGRVLALHRTMTTRTRLYAHHLRSLAVFFVEDPEVEGRPEDAEVSALKIAAGLRCTYDQAWAQVRDAHTAVDLMPLTFEYLRRGDLTEGMHQYLLRRVRRLSEEQARQVDAHLATIELPSVSWSTYIKHVRLAVELATAGALTRPPSQARDVEIVDVDTASGTASLLVTGPIPEIQGLAHRLDVQARTVQRAQRAALEDGAEGPVPFDIDQDLAQRGRPLSLRTLRYAILTHSVLDIDPVQETRSPYKILVTIPATTLLHLDDAPAMLEGMTPLPAELARALAAGEPTWQRILTDPLTGAHLPVTAQTYHPTAQMRLQLRLRHPVCAVPGCTRPTALAAEDDHIIEYDHQNPSQGGQTCLWNLHRLCWQHHQAKTAGLIDPERDQAEDPARAGHTTTGPLVTTWTLDQAIRTRSREHTDLLTARSVQALDRAWQLHQHLHAEAQRQHAEQKARPRTERAAQQRQDALTRAHPHRYTRRIIPPGQPPPDPGDPPF
ncbi:HNH endonuclease [Brachybacterium faecium DSM 4810]|uniref:HNH endonuclease n=1 Tax=Brachybacterium faecium (strain ATCC 43885 / DSM 4810 / JCM 11609 / LMG 19847 / NBRC 14762 / NCIMB 9860 / 6-10) TaxID=446465 RepID=C7MI52_BRAFD|nr:HNH endonuclease signature motif containing protein [Brachybacterium faecium]ACU84478.1 HNH endonuclease [Brachybacterium faecium DSM 4810]